MLRISPSAALLRQPCPNCGLTRATLAVLQGDLAAAFALNPIAVVVRPSYVALFAFAAWRYVTRGQVDLPRWALAVVVASGIALVALWAARLLGAFGGPVAV